jgi:hypothetical protein
MLETALTALEASQAEIKHWQKAATLIVDRGAAEKQVESERDYEIGLRAEA